MKSYKKAWKALQAVMNKHSAEGALDTEPQFHIERAVSLYMKSGNFEKKSSEQLELYSCMNSSKKAAANISKALKEVHKAVHKTVTESPVKDFSDMRDYFKGEVHKAVHKTVTESPVKDFSDMRDYFKGQFWYVELED
jgi:hypothetical protein